jgi:hypothetical protein
MTCRTGPVSWGLCIHAHTSERKTSVNPRLNEGRMVERCSRTHQSSLSGYFALTHVVTANPVGKATIAIHGSGTNAEPDYHNVAERPVIHEIQTHSFVERAPVTSKSPNITDRAWINGVLARTALWRERHKAVPLVWSTTLAQFALDSANKCQLAHTGGPYVSAVLCNGE